MTLLINVITVVLFPVYLVGISMVYLSKILLFFGYLISFSPNTAMNVLADFWSVPVDLKDLV